MHKSPWICTRLRKESIGGVTPHMHTVHSGTDLHNTCHLCAQSRSKRGQRRASRISRLRIRPGEQTVFSVGRFRVTHNDKKNPDSSGRVPDVLVGSGDHLDQSQDSDNRKDSSYNLRNMFKDVRRSSESTNGLALNVGKRRRSLTLFGLRRSSDPIAVKVVSTGREGDKFIPQPVVLEEPHNENENKDNEKKQIPLTSAANKIEEKTSISYASAIETQAANSIAMESLAQGVIDAPTTLTPAPNSFQMSFTSSLNPSEILVKNQQTQLSPGPLQTSTPLSPLPNLSKKIGSFAASSIFPIEPPSMQTPLDPCTSPVLENDSFSSPAFISLGSSPHSSIRTPTSPLAVTPSPKFTVKGCSQLASSPKLLSNEPSRSPLRSLDNSMTSSQTSSPIVGLQDEAHKLSCRSSIKTSSQTEPEGPTTQQMMEKPELNLGFLDVCKSSPQLSPSSPLGGRVSSFTIVKASTDSKKEFSAVTMVEDQAVASEVEPGDDGGVEVKWTSDEKDVGAVEEPEGVPKDKVLQD
ncbi:RELT-like protein 2 isoform X2 [Eucyclogobius newberryi]|uniref:RELT-like protein 2 isoform X2 n=1 Tax=Eucyclogobius newberryi TaxID=166745 RepID=UPI003B5AE5CF